MLFRACCQVRVHTGAGDFEGDACIVTVPLGVLKRSDKVKFLPPLPPRKQAAIQRLGFGCLNKVMLLFPHCFWGDKVGGFCVLCAVPARVLVHSPDLAVELALDPAASCSCHKILNDAVQNFGCAHVSKPCLHKQALLQLENLRLCHVS